MDGVDAGTLRHRIQLQSASETQSASGELTQTWTTFATVWACISPLSGKELELAAAKSIGATATHKIVIRYIPSASWETLTAQQWSTLTAAQLAALNSGPNAAVTVNTRINYNGRIFTINSVLNEDERNYKLTLIATEYLKQ